MSSKHVPARLYIWPVVYSFWEKNSVPTKMDKIWENSDSIRWIFGICSIKFVLDITEMDEFRWNSDYLSRIPEPCAKFLWLLQCIRQSHLALMRAEANVDTVVCSSHIAVMTNEVNSQCLLNLHNVLSKTQHGCVSITHVSVSQSVQRVATIHGFLIDWKA
jgi:hypothetical protein